MHESIGVDDVMLDLTEGDESGLDLVFAASVRYLASVHDLVRSAEIDGAYAVRLEFEDVHPVDDRVRNHLRNGEYESIGVTRVGPDEQHPRRKSLSAFVSGVAEVIFGALPFSKDVSRRSRLLRKYYQRMQ